MQSNWKTKYELPYHLLTDAEGEACCLHEMLCLASQTDSFERLNGLLTNMLITGAAAQGVWSSQGRQVHSAQVTGG